MKILLIYPYPLYDRFQEEDIKAVPMGVYYVGAVLKENHYDVEVLNWYDIHKTPEMITKVLVENKPDIIGFSILNANRWGGIEIAQIAKQIDPNVKIVFGGVAASFLWQHFLKHFPQVDFIVIGEGEYTFLNLVKLIEEKNYEDIDNIKGIAFRKNGKITRTEDPEAIQNLDELPIPAKYFEYQHIAFTRGCPWKCTFCGSPEFWGHKIRFHSPENFVRHLELLHNRGVTFFYFSDDNFTINKNKVIEICKGILEKKLKIVWVAISRVNYVDEDIFYWMRKAGCIQISYGVESGSERIRGLLSKEVATDQIDKAFALTHKYGLLSRAYFIYGSPEESWETIQDTIDLIHQIKPLICVLYILEIYPGTRLYLDFQEKFNVTDDIWLKQIEGICYFETDSNLSQETVFAFGKTLREEFYNNIHHFVESVDLIDKEEFFEMHSDFLSRLGMTFSHGDYSKVEAIKDKNEIAERLFMKSLSYYPNHRACLGLGIIKQKRKEFEESVKILSEGVRLFPESEELKLCLGISYMNLKDYNRAISYLVKLKHSKEAGCYIEQCHAQL
ncbi:MAG: B12-binding domain-containing radical SAM protein [Desulfobacterales bacterium C00003060]|nr:MAG: B12-binding domain-containing radical SAM protein [Desulfobacterales bacterium S3730MH5]OEU81234.1 MAG: B12-binding domain-containing radical SAM protein [Desulfobacterales bacterium C00003060]OEU83579.1 MAG: B12-binding domain-containing radical SAM protein [Desulfobacterales bacterium S5133MH4]